MRPSSAALLAVFCAVAPVQAANKILYSTAATTGLVYGHCLGPEGRLSPEPKFTAYLGGNSFPRRLLVANFGDDVTPKRVLYVATIDQVVAFAIGADGKLDRIGATEALQGAPQDIAVDVARRRLYVPERKRLRMVAYELGDDGAPLAFCRSEVAQNDDRQQTCTDNADQTFASCTKGVGFGSLALANDQLYYTNTSFGGGLEIVDLDDKGDLQLYPILNACSCASDADCGDGGTCDGTLGVCTAGTDTRIKCDANNQCATDQICTQVVNCGVTQIGTREKCSPESDYRSAVLSQRRNLGSPRTLQIDGSNLYVQTRSKGLRLAQFALDPDGTLDGDQRTFCPGADDLPKDDPAIKKAKAVSKSNKVFYYEDLQFVQASEPPAGKAIIGSVFAKGRLDSFLLGSDGAVPKKRGRSTPDSIRIRPARIRAFDGVLYVSGGDYDRIQAYRLDPQTGALRDTEPFSETNEIKGSFPDDVIGVTLDADCGG